MTNHDYSGALRRFDNAIKQSTPDANGKILGQRSPAFFRDDEIISIRHALTVMQKLPKFIEDIKIPPNGFNSHCYNSALDAVLEEINRWSKNHD
jgi:hypothetical protein